jgi:hypothetical protein
MANPALNKGYNETADLLLQTIDGVPLEQLYQEFIDTLALLNAQRNPLISRLTFPVDKPYEQVMPIAGAEFEEASEYGQPQGVRLGSPWNMGYDLKYFDLAQRFTWRFLGRAPANELRALNNAALEADQRLVAKTIMTRIFDNTNTSVTLEGTGTVTTAYPFYNGDITALQVSDLSEDESLEMGAIAGALIGFAGPRVIEQTIREKLPEGFQRAEYLAEHGMVDMVVHRHKLRPTLAELCRLLTRVPLPVATGQAQLPVPAHA